MLPETCEITDDIVAKIVLEYLSRRHLKHTYNCFLREYQDVPCISSENDNLLPQLEDILTYYFTKESGQRVKKEEKVYALWKQFDIVASQLRSMTLTGEKAKAFLRTRRAKNGISINDFEGIRSKQPKVASIDKDVQTEPVFDFITLYTNHNNHDAQTTNPCVYQQAYFTPHKEDTLLLHHQNDILASDQVPVENKTPAKELLKAELTKEFRSPKRKTSNPKRRSNPLDVLAKKNTITPLKFPSEEASLNNSDLQCVSPLLEKEDFTQMLKAMFSNSSFQEKLADNINKVTAGDLTTETGQLKDVERVVKQTTDELDLSELYTMLGDLNDHNDDEKKQMFFPSNNGVSSTIHDANSSRNEYNVYNQTIEKNDIVQQEHSNINALEQNDELVKTAEQIIQKNVLEQQIESMKIHTSHIQPILCQSVVRNLNSDLGMTKDIDKNVSLSGSSIVTSTQLVTTKMSPMFESQESYHNIERSPNCVDLKTPTKVVYINKDLAKLPMETNGSEEQPPLHESENIATDALLLLSTSPAKPPMTPQKEQFSFVKMLTDHYKPNFLENQSFQPSVNNATLNEQEVLVPNVSELSKSKALTVSDPSQLSEDPPNDSNRDNRCGATDTRQPQRTFYEKPNKDVVSHLPTILPKTSPQKGIAPVQVLRPVIMNIPPSPVRCEQNVYNQLDLQTSDKKYQQKERQRKSREKKKNQKKQIVTRFLSFNNTSQSTNIIPAPSSDTVGSDIQNLTPFFNFETKSSSQDAFSFDKPALPDKTNLLEAASDQQTKGSASENISNIIPMTTISQTESLKLPSIDTIVNKSSCLVTSNSNTIAAVQAQRKPKFQFILPHKEIDHSVLLKSNSVNVPIIAHKSSSTLDTCSEDSRQCVSDISSQEPSVKIDHDKTVNVKPCTGKSKNKKPMKVKFNFKSPRKKSEGIGENPILKTPAGDQETLVDPPLELSPDVYKKNTTPLKHNDTEHEIVAIPRFPTEISFSFLQQDNTIDSSDRINDLVLKLASEESIDLKVEQSSKEYSIDSNDTATANSVGKKRNISDVEDKVEREPKKRKKKHRTNLDKLKTVNVQELLSKIHSPGGVTVT